MGKRLVWVGGAVVALAASRCSLGDLCGGNDSPCTSTAVPGTHTISVEQGFCGGCVLQCATGWSDCDDVASNGCETPGKCASLASDSGAPSGPALVATLSGAPHGLAACGTDVFYFDDAVLYQVSAGTTPKKRATSTGTPAGGIACDGTFVYWATVADDGGSNGTVFQLPIWATSATSMATGIDPAAGVDLRGSSVYWIQRTADAGSMLAHTTGDAGWTTIMPASATSVYKSFALTSSGDYAIDQGTIWFNALADDAGGPTQVATGTNALALIAGSSAAPYAISPATGSDSLAQLLGDGGVTAIPTIVAATAIGTTALFAADDSVYAFDLQTRALTTLSQPVLHAVDVALDSSGHAYWTTRGEGVTLGAVWTAPVP